MLDLNRLPEAIKHEGGVSRRLFFAYASALSSIPLLGKVATVESRPAYQDDPFSLGVASGDPDSTSAVLWTRIATKPLEPGGGMSDDAVKVKWEIAEDDSFKKVVRQGDTLATPQLGHSVHVTAGLSKISSACRCGSIIA